MIKYFDIANGGCHVVVNAPLTQESSSIIKSILSREYDSWHIEFGHIYNVEKALIDILYEEIFQNGKKVSITTHKHKLSRYLHNLGFQAKFDSLLKEEIVDIDSVEVILLGGSADSSTKVMEIVKNATLKNLSLIVVQHVEADKKGFFDEILKRYTNYDVSYAQDGEKIKKSHIYLAPPNRHLKVSEGRFVLSDEDKYNYSKPSVSLSYESFSSFYKEKLLVIQQCGYANDGVDRLEFLKAKKSKLVIQDASECEAKPMVVNALNVGVHDFVLNLKDVITLINVIDNVTTKEAWMEYLLDKIYERRNYDFRLYHKDMVARRMTVFMLKHEIKSVKNAIAMILFNQSAFKGFFLEVSINVTELFRKPKSFKLSLDILNRRHKHSRSVKIWSAGCSSGEEVYSLAILLDSLGLLERSIIYATDFNAVVLQEAKNGAYSIEEYEIAKENFKQIGLKTDLNDYLKANNNYVSVDEKIKSKTLFFQHNLIEDSSFNEFDIIICKNVIIYFNDVLQKKVFKLFYDSLKFGGHLVLGESEAISPMFADKFEKLNDECKIYRKIA